MHLLPFGYSFQKHTEQLPNQRANVTTAMSDLERVKAQRKAHRGVVIRIINEATPLLEGKRTKRILTHLKTTDEQLVEKTKTLQGLDEEILKSIGVSEIEDNVLESEAIVEKIAQLHGEINTFIEKPWKLPKEHDDSHVRVLSVDTRSKTSRMECPSSAESSRTEESDLSIKVETENPNLKTGGIKQSCRSYTCQNFQARSPSSRHFGIVLNQQCIIILGCLQLINSITSWLF